ncbi:MAG: 50S ribosomal protein L24 [Chloroflexota bacterium]
MKIKRDDTILVIAGKDRGKTGKVHQVLPEDGKVVVAGVNIIKRHTKPKAGVRQAGIVEREAPLDISNVEFLCPRCNKPSRVGQRVLEDGNKVRYCRACDEVIG